MLELLWLLLPVAALSGWWIGQHSPQADRKHASSPRSFPHAYYQGLSYLLNEERDKALEAFTRMAEVDGETAEVHLALGSLFRNRGEVDRAIRIHQSLIARPSLSRRERSQALLALGEDHLKAGVLDRAENLFKELLADREYAAQALRHLLTLYEHEKEWSKAIEMAQRLQRQGDGRQYRARIGQLRCELAAEARSRGDTGQARQLLRLALEEDPGCVRANILRGDLERELGRYKAALKAYEAVAEQDPGFLPEVLEGLEASYRALGRPGQMETFLREVIARSPEGALVVRLVGLIEQHRGPREALDELALLLRRAPSLEGLRRLVDLTRTTGEPIGKRELQLFYELLDGLEAERPRYRCQRCGFSGRFLFWQCPGCKAWATLRPIGEVETA